MNTTTSQLDVLCTAKNILLLDGTTGVIHSILFVEDVVNVNVSVDGSIRVIDALNLVFISDHKNPANTILVQVDPEFKAELQKRNAATTAWVNEDPTNRWASGYVEDLAHWAEVGVRNIEQLERYLRVCNAYELYKEVHGFRCSWNGVQSMTEAELDKFMAGLEEEMAQKVKETEARQSKRIEEFEAQIAKVMEMGAATRYHAFNWIFEAEGLGGEREVGYILYCLDLPESYRNEIENALL